MRIKQLPKEVFDLIAAGEVVLAPVSVVKELVENALDAGASRIIVETVSGGIERIRVADNGTGISREDIELAFSPHATSKLNSAEDLFNIETLGFRGEALASIAAVSSVTMTTKTETDSSSGTRAFSEGGGIPALSPAGADKGTDITVENLFFNIPARKKHLGERRAEGRRITEYLSKAAVSRPRTAVRVIADGELVFATPGNGDRMAAIAAVYGSKIAENLIPVHTGGDELSLEAYVSGVLGMRGNRKGQHFFVNGRPVSNAALETAVSSAYREFAEPGRFPVVFLFLSVDHGTVDVNVHPAKNEISFEDAGKVSGFVCESIRNTLRSGAVIPKLRVSGGSSDTTFWMQSEEQERTHTISASVPEKTLVSTFGGAGEKVDMVDVKFLLSSAEDSRDDQGDPGGISRCVYGKELQSTMLSENQDAHYSETLKIQSLQALATLFATYILASDGGDAFYMIDQHAAHERVNYEYFLDAFQTGEVFMQKLLTPYLFTPPATLVDLTPYIGFFSKIGYEIDAFGEFTWAARSFPAFISQEEAEAFLLEVLAAIGDGNHDRDKKIAGSTAEPINAASFDRIVRRACKSSVKANRKLSDAEITSLLEALSKCGNPYTCPHGRPVFLKLTKRDIERMFKRA